VNIADELKKIRISLAHDGFVAILEEVAVAVVSQVKCDGVSCQQPAHEGGKLGCPWTKEQMEVIGHECPGQALGSCCYEKVRHAFDKTGFVTIVDKDVAPFDAANYDVLKQTWYVYAGRPWHGR